MPIFGSVDYPLQEPCLGPFGSRAEARREYLEEKAAKYNLQPVGLGLFGGIHDYNKMSWLMKRAPPIQASRRKLEAFYKEKREVYDTRDMDAIRDWAKELSQKTRT